MHAYKRACWKRIVEENIELPSPSIRLYCGENYMGMRHYQLGISTAEQSEEHKSIHEYVDKSTEDTLDEDEHAEHDSDYDTIESESDNEASTIEESWK